MIVMDAQRARVDAPSAFFFGWDEDGISDGREADFSGLAARRYVCSGLFCHRLFG